MFSPRALATFLCATAVSGFAAAQPRPGGDTIQIGPPTAAPGTTETWVDPTRPASVGMLAPPTATDLDEGPVSDSRKTLTWIGFHQAPGYSRLFFKTTDRVAFEVVPSTGVILVRLKNTRVRLSNNLRFLDTSYFASSVWKVVPHRRKRDLLTVEIQMREAVAYKIRRRGDEIQFDFELPAKK